MSKDESMITEPEQSNRIVSFRSCVCKILHNTWFMKCLYTQRMNNGILIIIIMVHLYVAEMMHY